MDYSWPDELELFEFFETDPVESNPSDGFWRYERSGSGGLILTFSFNIHERSIQTNLSLNGELVTSVCHEGAQGMCIEEERNVKLLRATFEDRGYIRELMIKLQPKCFIQWSVLEIKT